MILPSVWSTTTARVYGAARLTTLVAQPPVFHIDTDTASHTLYTISPTFKPLINRQAIEPKNKKSLQNLNNEKPTKT
eukprot:3863676-Amphidinium_carterae.3